MNREWYVALLFMFLLTIIQVAVFYKIMKVLVDRQFNQSMVSRVESAIEYIYDNSERYQFDGCPEEIYMAKEVKDAKHA